jgi:hydrogenase expression/formation protein HypE
VNKLDTHISLAHGNGGRLMRELIEELFARQLANDDLDVHADAVTIALPGGEVVVTTDGFTVQPLEFPGGDIGSLAVHGTVNDLAVAGAIPRYLTLNAFIEEGTEIALLERIVASLAAAAAAVGVSVVAGDTKVLRRGEGGGIYLATTGVGTRDGRAMDMRNIRDGDSLLVSGPVGDHGIAVMLAREAFGLRGDIRSDAGSVLALAQAALRHDGLRFMRDPTRGGLATVCAEIARATGLGVRLQQAAVPVRDAVVSVCEMLGYDPLYLACEGRIVAVVDSAAAEAVLDDWQRLPEGEGAAVIGRIDGRLERVVLETPLGGERLLEELEDDPLPRIC